MTLDASLSPDDAATAWFARLQADDASPDDFAAFTAWLEADPAHPAAYDRVEQLWVAFDSVQATAPTAVPPAAFPRRPRRAPAGPRRLAKVMGWAGAAAAAGLVGFIVLGPAASQIYETPAGQRRDIALADGTHIALAGASKVRVRLDDRRRAVALVEGEALFDIAADKTRPFEVALGDQTVRDVGTVFNLSRRGSEQQITVVSGAVAVSGKGANEVWLGPGDQLSHRDGRPGSVKTRVDAAEVVAWRSGRFVFRARPLGEVVQILNRHVATPLKPDRAAAALSFTGMLKIGDSAAVAEQLAQLLPVRASVGQDSVLLIARSASPAQPEEAGR